MNRRSSIASWNVVPLANKCRLIGGYGFPEQLQGSTVGDLPFIKVSDMSLPRNQQYIIDATNFVDKEIAKRQGWTPFPQGSVVFAKVGAALKLNRRRILTRPTIIDNNMMAAIPDQTQLDTLFLYYYLASVDFAKFVQEGALPSVNQEQVGSLLIPDIPLEEQRRVAEILQCLDVVICKTEMLIGKLNQIKAGLLHDLLTRGLDENGELRDPVAHPEQFKDSLFGLIPAEWALTPLEDVASRQPNSLVDGPFGSNLKTTEYSDEGVRLVQLQNIGEGVWHDDNRKFIPETKFQQLIRHAAYPGDIVIAKMADPIARACLLPEVSDRYLVVADCIKLTVDTSRHDPNFIVYAINHRNFRSQAEKISTGTTRQRINLSTLKKLILAIPPSSEQVRIVKVLKLYDELIQSEHDYLNKLRLLQKGLMHDLLTGKVRVPLDKEEE